MKTRKMMLIGTVVLTSLSLAAYSGSKTGTVRPSQPTSSKKVPAKKIKPDVPVEYENALAKAKIYAEDMFMSKQGIYQQLTSESEGFKKKAAAYAIKHVKADWNKNALEKAKTYQKEMHMSKNAIYNQLTSSYGERFTPDQAKYAIDHLAK
jgi:hypothetical protein